MVGEVSRHLLEKLPEEHPHREEPFLEHLRSVVSDESICACHHVTYQRYQVVVPCLGELRAYLDMRHILEEAGRIDLHLVSGCNETGKHELTLIAVHMSLSWRNGYVFFKYSRAFVTKEGK